ncbi:MAG: putative ABC transporter permease, partial [Ruminococcus sp.]|nr:putative ABC transporter permease [Ruminococcus sp.]
LFLVIVLSGIFGWVYEFIFYYFDGGTGEFYMQGGNFLPWINIYAIGAVLIIIATQKIKRYPWAVFLVAMVVAGLVELIGGWLVYTMFDGARYWDYNTEILNFGNIGGFVCLRSVLFFGVSALFLTYVMVPFCIFLAKRMSKRAFGFFAPHFALEIIPNTAPGIPNRIPHPQHPKTTEMIPQTREMMLNTFAAPVGPSAGAAL